MSSSTPRPDRGAAVVTAASQGLGLAIAERLFRAGFEVLVTDLDAGQAADAAKGLGGWSARLDPRYDQACEVIAERAAERGGLAVWVNNAGVLDGTWTHTAGMRRRILDVNAIGVMNGTVAAVDVMRTQGYGQVVNVMSLAGALTGPSQAIYAASKHAIQAFSAATRADLRASGVTGVDISCVLPDGHWNPAHLEDAGAAVSFDGALLTPERIATRIATLVTSPHPVPRWYRTQPRTRPTLKIATIMRLGARKSRDHDL
jgi:NADP-dependent 3-hydroxy acid dehydrogenase YdfG